MKKGLFITFEGADGCGKTTQLELVSKYLSEKGIVYITTREPGATELGVKLREILLNYDGEVAPECETFLFLADRAQHIETKVKPALEEGKIVLCDRHTDSTVAYQGYGRGQDIGRIKCLNDIAVNGLKPDLTLVFDVDSDVAAKRVGKDKDRMESAGDDFHKKVKEGYLKIAKEESERVKIVNANLNIEQVFEQTKKIIEAKL